MTNVALSSPANPAAPTSVDVISVDPPPLRIIVTEFLKPLPTSARGSASPRGRNVKQISKDQQFTRQEIEEGIQRAKNARKFLLFGYNSSCNHCRHTSGLSKNLSKRR